MRSIMSDIYLRPIRLDHSVVFLAVELPSDTFLLNSDRTLMAFRAIKDARDSFPEAYIPMCSYGSRSDWVIDLDAALTWSAKARLTGIESVNQSEDFGDVIELLEMLEYTGVGTDEMRHHFQSTEELRDHIFGTNILTFAAIPELTAGELEQLRIMFDEGIAAIRRKLPKSLIQPSEIG